MAALPKVTMGSEVFKRQGYLQVFIINLAVSPVGFRILGTILLDIQAHSVLSQFVTSSLRLMENKADVMGKYQSLA